MIELFNRRIRRQNKRAVSAVAVIPRSENLVCKANKPSQQERRNQGEAGVEAGPVGHGFLPPIRPAKESRAPAKLGTFVGSGRGA